MSRAIALIAATALLGGGEKAERPPREDVLVVESAGRVGLFDLGAPVGQYRGLLKPAAEGTFTSGQGVHISTDEEERIERIEIDTSRYFTQRLVRPGRSTLADVVEQYGAPATWCSRKGRLTLVYRDGLELTVEAELGQALAEAGSKELLAARVRTIALQRHQESDSQGYRRALNAARRNEWTTAAAELEDLLCHPGPARGSPRTAATVEAEDRRGLIAGPAPEQPSAPRPHLLLARAFAELGDCRSALAELEVSRQLGSLTEVGAWRDRLGIRCREQTPSPEPVPP